MTIEELEAVHKAAPFAPFTLNLADGRSYRIRHPEYLSHHPKGRTLIVYKDDGGFEIIDLLLVVGIEVEPGRPARPRRKTG